MAAKTILGMDRTLVRAGERVCVAVSGGADSTALLLGLVEANAEKQPLGVALSAAHVHHGLRGAEADGDEAFVRALCGRLGVPLRVFRVDTAARQAAEGEGLEEAARALRYEALRGLMSSGVVDVVATAHTLDDQAETVVMKMLRGAWTEGLGGISPVLESGGATGEKQILRFAKDDNSFGGKDDNSFWGKDGNSYRYKGRIVRPLLGVRRAEVARVLPQVLLPGKPVRGGGRSVSTAVGEASYSVEIARLAAMPAALRRRVVRAVVRALYASSEMASGMSSEETAKVLALAGFGGHARVMGKIGSRLELHAGLRVERSARELRFWRQG